MLNSIQIEIPSVSIDRILVISLRLQDWKIEISVPEMLSEQDGNRFLVNFSILLQLRNIMQKRCELDGETQELKTGKQVVNNIINLLKPKFDKLNLE